MNPRTTSSYYARQSAAAHRQLGSALSDAERFRALLVEYDAALRAASAYIPAGVVPLDLAERTRRALAGEPLTTTEIIKAAANRLEREQGARP